MPQTARERRAAIKKNSLQDERVHVILSSSSTPTVLPDLAPGSELEVSTFIQRPNWLPGFHRAGPSTPRDESRARYSDSGQNGNMREGFCQLDESCELDMVGGARSLVEGAFLLYTLST